MKVVVLSSSASSSFEISSSSFWPGLAQTLALLLTGKNSLWAHNSTNHLAKLVTSFGLAILESVFGGILLLLLGLLLQLNLFVLDTLLLF